MNPSKCQSAQIKDFAVLQVGKAFCPLRYEIRILHIQLRVALHHFLPELYGAVLFLHIHIRQIHSYLRELGCSRCMIHMTMGNEYVVRFLCQCLYKSL